MENCLAQVLQKDVGRRLQVGQEIIDYISDREKSHDLEQDQTLLDKMVDGIATSWVNSSNFKVRRDFEPYEPVCFGSLLGQQTNRMSGRDHCLNRRVPNWQLFS